ncbi:lipopolysaccharide transport periplasmic protein LptA [Thioclava sp. F34-6]|uniref:lipopolysaccharide transport periplasmic protein LptA n=1 Tax=Thioclava sp. F34-6 TaxID=1973003 RepID=UPI000B6AE99C|nr:lipopolysaccharide transport periplasmic protein LptA [Thioclava sp. F34-6]OWY13156.1 lipopolysaccharide transport periplasmic protein LptA [Thioclava sp. F34-6]
MFRARFFTACAMVVSFPVLVMAQSVDFGGLRADKTAPVEVTADSLNVDQQSGQAVFSGNVEVTQGDMHMKAAELEVFYASDKRSEITKLHATGGVTLVSPTEAAEAEEAVYDVKAGTVVMTGKVLLTQGNNVMSGNKLNVDLSTGTGTMDGRVRTLLKPAGSK